ncbi:protein phosphatase 2C [Tritrichomonas foetus]|uniref:Protein phosphatase 2C n=1 Tax=Tritrichomonas foetus TaxID=1144522 RepID=A0A1J4L0D8_9EUKA|nr:protein phosphatase 2C [Tritrichomonas foetus]|eukprot:OHT16600.1 protein phosphatase 2C [Tritrichomonas foetus]
MGNDQSLPFLKPDIVNLCLKGKGLKTFPFIIPPDHQITSIDISYNRILEIPPNLKQLHFLDYGHNNIKSISSNLENVLTSYSSLSELNLAGNSLSEIPSSLTTLKTMRSLYINQNQIKEFNLKFKSLQSLDLSCNLLSQFNAITNSLTILNLSFNRLTSLTFFSSNLKELNLSGNDLSELPENICFETLFVLNISYNKIISLKHLSKITPQLEVINFSYNAIKSFPDPLPLTIMNINAIHNQITNMPTLINYTNLKSLLLDENQITTLPSLPPSIVEITLENNSLEECGTISLPIVKQLVMNYNNLESIPCFSNSSITTFSAAFNQISTINISSFTHKIVRLDLSSNNIKILPNELFSLPELKQLILFQNNIYEIPKEIVSSSITVLNISNNPISNLPPMPSSLSLISAHCCNFDNFPETLMFIPCLECIDLSNNRIASFTEPIHSLLHLKTLFFSCNQIEEFPELPFAVKHVDFSQNKIKSIKILASLENILEFDVSHNELIEFIIDAPMPNLISLKMSHNSNLRFTLSFSNFPSLDCLDLSHTNVNINSREPIKKMRELIRSKTYSITPMIKIFSDEKAGYAEMKGNRMTMEDALIIRHMPFFDLYGVIDGHAGYRTSTWTAFKLPQLIEKFETHGLIKAIQNLNTFLQSQNVNDGATIALVLKRGNKLIAVNIGDSRSIVVKKDGSTIPLSYDHKPYEREELEEIRERGSFVEDSRTSGVLSISRAVGDFFLKGVSSCPNIKEFEITDDDFRVVIACDGVFDVLTNDDVGRIVVSEDSPSVAAYKVRNCAYSHLSGDNISVIVFDLHN